jgi:hypothetical protein
MYKLHIPFGRTEPNCVIKTDSMTFIPFDPANTDYQKYLEWLAVGNQPISADAGEGNAPLGADEPLPADAYADTPISE